MKGLSEAKVDKMQKECETHSQQLLKLTVLLADTTVFCSVQAGAYGFHNCNLNHGAKKGQHQDWNRLPRV